MISILNSTSTLLTANNDFIGTYEDVSAFESVSIIAYAQQPTSILGMALQWSDDGINFVGDDRIFVDANAGAYLAVPVKAQFVRVIYYNGVVDQTYFRLQTIYHSAAVSNDIQSSFSTCSIQGNVHHSFGYGCSTFQTLGNSLTSHPLFTIESSLSGLYSPTVRIKRLILVPNFTATLTSLDCQVKVFKCSSLPTGGSVLSKTPLDSDVPSQSNIVCKGATASDGGSATPITISGTQLLWQGFVGRLQTAAGQVLPQPVDLLSLLSDKDAMLLRPTNGGESLAVELIVSSGSNNPSTNHYIVNCLWEEI